MMQFAVVSCLFVCICLRFSFFFFQTIVRILSLYKSSDYRNVDDGQNMRLKKKKKKRKRGSANVDPKIWLLFVIGVCVAWAAALFINRYSIRIAIVAYKFRTIKLFQ